MERTADDVTCLAHVLEGQAFARLQDQVEKARIGLKKIRPTRTSTPTPTSTTGSRPGGHSAESEVRRWRPASARRRSSDLPPGAVGRGGAAPRAVRILFSGSELLLLDRPTNHLDATPARGSSSSCAPTQGALVVVSHDLDLLDMPSPACPHRPRDDEGPGTLVEYKALTRST